MARPKKTAPTPAAGYGHGSVYEEPLGSGQWRAELEGVRKRASSEDDARQKLLILQQQRDGRLQIGKGAQTLATWYQTWLDLYCSHLKAKTREGYADALRLYIQPYAIARVRLEDLSADHIDRWLAQLRKRPRTVQRKKGAPAKSGAPVKLISAGTVAIAFRRMRKALDVAWRKSIIAENPADKADPPMAPAPSTRPVLTEGDALAFLAAWRGQRLYPLFALVLSIGLRRGELLGLRWSDIDLQRQTLTVRGQLQWLKVDADRPRQPVWIDSPKTRAGQRTIDLSDEITVVLRAWRKAQIEERLQLVAWQAGDYVFSSEEGTCLRPDNLNRSFKLGLARAKLPDMRFHDLRHAAGSLMLARGEDLESVRELLGHSSRAVLEKTYAHALRDRKKRAGASLGFLLREEA